MRDCVLYEENSDDRNVSSLIDISPLPR